MQDPAFSLKFGHIKSNLDLINSKLDQQSHQKMSSYHNLENLFHKMLLKSQQQSEKMLTPTKSNIDFEDLPKVGSKRGSPIIDDQTMQHDDSPAVKEEDSMYNTQRDIDLKSKITKINLFGSKQNKPEIVDESDGDFFIPTKSTSHSKSTKANMFSQDDPTPGNGRCLNNENKDPNSFIFSSKHITG